MKKNGFFEDGFISDTLTQEEIKNSSILIENKKFAGQYSELMRQEGNQKDLTNQYRRTIMQTANIGLASAILIFLIYKQM